MKSLCHQSIRLSKRKGADGAAGRAYRYQAENLLKFMPPIEEYVTPNLLEVDTTQTLGADDGRVRAEVKRIANGGTPHPPPLEPVKFLTSSQEDCRSDKTRCEEMNNTVQADSMDVQQDNPPPINRSYEYFEMEDAIYSLTDEV